MINENFNQIDNLHSYDVHGHSPKSVSYYYSELSYITQLPQALHQCEQSTSIQICELVFEAYHYAYDTLYN